MALGRVEIKLKLLAINQLTDGKTTRQTLLGIAKEVREPVQERSRRRGFADEISSSALSIGCQEIVFCVVAFSCLKQKEQIAQVRKVFFELWCLGTLLSINSLECGANASCLAY
jgi:hypothetical protein